MKRLGVGWEGRKGGEGCDGGGRRSRGILGGRREGRRERERREGGGRNGEGGARISYYRETRRVPTAAAQNTLINQVANHMRNK